jgi:hypothetical protein
MISIATPRITSMRGSRRLFFAGSGFAAGAVLELVTGAQAFRFVAAVAHDTAPGRATRN